MSNPYFLFFLKLIIIIDSSKHLDKYEECFGVLIKKFIGINDS